MFACLVKGSIDIPLDIIKAEALYGIMIYEKLALLVICLFIMLI